MKVKKVWFEGEPIDRAYPGDRYLKIILCKYSLHWIDEYDQEHELEIPARFCTDLASVPALLTPVIPPWDNLIKHGAVAHDRAYETHEVSRELADALLYYSLLERGASYSYAYAVWLGVRAGGYWSYQSAKERQEKRLKKLAELEVKGEFQWDQSVGG